MPTHPAKISLSLSHLLHGGDYNPDQWIRTPEVLNEDLHLMKLSGCNTATLGIFSWSSLEPTEGRFTFDWLDSAMNRLVAQKISVILATPSGSRPAWLAQKYPDTMIATAPGQRQLFSGRHNHCRSSPIYREKCRIINTQLAQRYKDHPALILWHVSNEYSGHGCHCDRCRQAFRNWLRERYHNNLDELNHAWWSTFWSHNITDWNQIHAPGPRADICWHGLNLDWKRFITQQVIDFFRAEATPLRQYTPHIPITTNLMGFYPDLDYWKIAQELDIVSWDSYPAFHDRPDDWQTQAVATAFLHSMNRSYLRKPFVLMECAPSAQNWQPVNKLKRPGVHILEGLQAVAHGSESVLYFQWRKSRGGCEKFHGAVVDHAGTPNTRVFREVSELGQILQKLAAVAGTHSPAQVAILYDCENRWAIEDSIGPRNKNKDYGETCLEHYRPFWAAGINIDAVSEDSDFTGYKLLIAPMLYMLRPGVAEKIDAFVRAGGTLVTTYLTGIADEHDLCFLTGFPGLLRPTLGIWAEEIDVLHDGESVPVVPVKNSQAGLKGKYHAGIFCDLIHAEGAKVLATYGGEFYQGRPALTVNTLGKGQAYYIASRNDRRFQTDFYNHLINQLKLDRALNVKLPQGVTAAVRVDPKSKRQFIFVLDFNRRPVPLNLGPTSYTNVLTGQKLRGPQKLPAYSHLILEKQP